ncbi:MAG: hypothetical protein EKK56_05540 [Flavobacteriaceae bacterium]|nr:MAG: hypothetical protein EKK56_05540 [Flavobacteriaceae bacterium]
MKKIILTLIAFTLMGCSSESDNVSSNSIISPPAWIQGVWLQDNGNGGVANNGYQFTTDDFILKGLVDYSFKNQINTNLSVGANSTVVETKTDNIYNISITLSTATSNYNFVKISSTKIEWVNDPMGDLVETYYIKQ